MKKLLNCLRSERPLVAGALGRFADEFGLGRAWVRIIGFLVLWAGSLPSRSFLSYSLDIWHPWLHRLRHHYLQARPVLAPS
jgi:hypothetical protein